MVWHDDITSSDFKKRHLSMLDTDLDRLKELVGKLEPRFKAKD
jgi:hypothetical protein